MQVHLNGRLLPVTEARISPLDRGFIFGDGVYEGMYAVPDPARGEGAVRIVGLNRHIKRLAEGMAALGISGWSPAELGEIAAGVCRASKLSSAFVYFQITRGAPAAAFGLAGSPRARVPEIPAASAAPPALGGPGGPCTFAFAKPFPAPDSFDEPGCRSAVVREDQRWRLGRIKSISLAGNVVAAIDADRAGAEDAILIRGGEVGVVCESLAANVVVVTADGQVVTPSLDSAPILAGVTRAILLDQVPALVARPVSVRELRAAREVMICGTTTLVTAITRLDGKPVGGGDAGPVARDLLRTLISTIGDGADDPAV